MSSESEGMKLPSPEQMRQDIAVMELQRLSKTFDEGVRRLSEIAKARESNELSNEELNALNDEQEEVAKKTWEASVARNALR